MKYILAILSLAIFIVGCADKHAESTAQIGDCGDSYVQELKEKALNTENSDKSSSALKFLLMACNCDDAEACINAIRIETDQKRVCNYL